MYLCVLISFSLAMAALCSAVLVCLSALLSVGSSGGLPDISDPQFIQSCVKLHNTHRSQAQPPARDMQYMVRLSLLLYISLSHLSVL